MGSWFFLETMKVKKTVKSIVSQSRRDAKSKRKNFAPLRFCERLNSVIGSWYFLQTMKGKMTEVKNSQKVLSRKVAETQRVSAKTLHLSVSARDLNSVKGNLAAKNLPN